MFFEKIENLNKLENINQWKSVINQLYDNWKEDKINPGKLLRLATECWYVLAEWQFLKINEPDLTKEFVKERLIETYSVANDKLNNDSKVLAMFGYMVSLFPYYFYDSNDKSDKTFLVFEKKGKEMLKKAVELNANNEIIQLLYLNSTKNEYHKLDAKRKSLQKALPSYFSNDTEVERYFNEVLTK